MYPSENISITTSSLFHFSSPSPFLNYEDDSVFLQNLNDLFTSTDFNMQSATQVTHNNNMADSTTSTTLDPMVQRQGNTNQSSTKREPKKRTSKKDRHSKIDTVHGPRDRRMRLSLDVARKFFGLQDLLGFEKASKTVAWLLAQSESAIKSLERAINNADVNSSNNNIGSSNNLGVVNSASPTSECEVLSGIQEPRVELAPKPKVKTSPEKKRKGAIVRRAAFDSTARELREKARERARERTEKKRNLQVGDKLNLSRLGSPSRPPKNDSFVEVENRSSNDETNAIDDDHEEGINTTNKHDIFEDPFWNSSTFFNYHHNSHEIPEFQAYAKPWEGYSNCI